MKMFQKIHYITYNFFNVYAKMTLILNDSRADHKRGYRKNLKNKFIKLKAPTRRQDRAGSFNMSDDRCAL